MHVEQVVRNFSRYHKYTLGTDSVPVAWIGETGRRVGVIAERVLVRRWAYRAGATIR